MVRKTIKTRVNSNERYELDSIIIDSYESFIRLERRNLLISSSITLVSYFGGVQLKGIDTSFIQFADMNDGVLFSILLTINIYFLIAFCIYAYPNYRKSMKRWKEITSKTCEITSDFPPIHIEDSQISDIRFLLWKFINFYLPILLGTLATIVGLLKLFV